LLLLEPRKETSAPDASGKNSDQHPRIQSLPRQTTFFGVGT
jgi:hypothetical protein